MLDLLNDLLIYYWILYFKSEMIVMNIQVFGLGTIKISDENIFGMNQYKWKDKDSILAVLAPEEKSIGCKVGIDTHVDTSCAGNHVRLLDRFDD